MDPLKVTMGTSPQHSARPAPPISPLELASGAGGHDLPPPLRLLEGAALEARLTRAARVAAESIPEPEIAVHPLPARAVGFRRIVGRIQAGGPEGEPLAQLASLEREVTRDLLELEAGKDRFHQELRFWCAGHRAEVLAGVPPAGAAQVDALLQRAVETRLVQFDARHLGPGLRLLQAAIGWARESCAQVRPSASIRAKVREAMGTVIASALVLCAHASPELELGPIRDRILAMMARRVATPPPEDLPLPLYRLEMRLERLLEVDDTGDFVAPELSLLQIPFLDALPKDPLAVSAWEGMVTVGLVVEGCEALRALGAPEVREASA